MVLTVATEALLKKATDVSEDSPTLCLLGKKLESPDGEVTVLQVQEHPNGYIINGKYMLGFFKAAEIFGGSI
jgi:hypothetical protein